MSLVSFAQKIGGTLFLAIAETAFSHESVSSLGKLDPSLSPNSPNAGAFGFRDVVSEKEIGLVLPVYSNGTKVVFYIAAGLGRFNYYIRVGLEEYQG